MRVAGAVAQFGPAAAPAIAALLKSADGEERKLGVAILSENALPIASNLLKSRNCGGSEKWNRNPRRYVARSGEGASRHVKDRTCLRCQLMMARF
jgi:hypothetical protein